MRRLIDVRRPGVAAGAAAALLVVALGGFGLIRQASSTPVEAGQPPAPSLAIGYQLPESAASGDAAEPDSAPAAPSVVPPGSSPAAPPAGDAADDVKVLDWLMHYTPGGTGSVTPLQAYSMLSEMDCHSTELDLDDRAIRLLYASAGAACLAAFHGRTELWAQASDGLDRLASLDTRGFACFDHDVLTMLTALVAVHRDFPGARLETAAGGTMRTTCPRITAISPDHGPLAGGQEVYIDGLNLPPVLTVWFHGESAAVASIEGTSARVITPPASWPGPVEIAVTGYFFATDVVYTYDPDPAPAASGG